MRWHELVFSNQPRYRNRRHLICWLFWWVYLIFTIFFTTEPIAPRNPAALGNFYHHQPGLNELGYLQYSLLVSIKAFLLLLTHFFFCYVVIYLLLPNFLSKKKYIPLTTTILLTCVLMVPVGYFLYSLAYPFIDNLFNLHLGKPSKSIVWASIDAGLINAIRVTLVAAAITLLKRWWLKQKEKERLEHWWQRWT